MNVPNFVIGFMVRYASKYPNTISLSQGTPLFSTPQFIYDAIYQRTKVDHELRMYSNTKIEKPLKELIIKQMNRLYGFTPDLQEIYLTVGGIGTLFSAFMILLQKGDKVIYFDPSYPLHLSQIYISEARPIFVSYNEDNKWSLDLSKLKKSITKKTKAIILTNPNNPTGTILSEKKVRELAKIILRYNLVLILDEAYQFLTYDTLFFSPLRIPELRKNIIVCKSFSKEFAMTGWRIGYVYANKDIIAKINDIHTYFSISSPTISIVAATIALSDKQEVQAMQYFKIQFEKSREAICNRLARLPKLFSFHKPAGAYYVFPKIIGLKMNSFDFAKKLVDEAQVITIPGNTMAPSGEKHLRMSFATDSSVIHKAFDRIYMFAKKNKIL